MLKLWVIGLKISVKNLFSWPKLGKTTLKRFGSPRARAARVSFLPEDGKHLFLQHLRSLALRYFPPLLESEDGVAQPLGVSMSRFGHPPQTLLLRWLQAAPSAMGKTPYAISHC